ncbi:DUF3726 domain-containing protein [Roseovarius sp. SCSIO 43702]|uniref:DUF3726 domain-containing protein n=1 Tax=Roseovarius sp. SCSIO 43702 TaxID=2823043 RepID=UPI001C73092E|nr:DUF3726 domain-containing protein [Roseovarius sp. SCSIO 43702]QYX55849.1 DUF3726 domain-containing protein [Roseovarius sp. SCSIO 43702]
MSWSLNEVEGLSRRATRGAGLSWGLAEDAGRAIRWICAMGLPGADALARVLTEIDGAEYERIAPRDLGPEWRAPGERLCPLVAGAALCDMAGTLAEGAGISLFDVPQPLLLYPYLAAASDMTGCALRLSWEDTVLTRHARVTYLQSDAPDAAFAARVDVARAPGEPLGRPARRAWRGDISTDTARILGDFARRTYAPETDARRMAGAGAGLTDND